MVTALQAPSARLAAERGATFRREFGQVLTVTVAVAMVASAANAALGPLTVRLALDTGFLHGHREWSSW